MGWQRPKEPKYLPHKRGLYAIYKKDTNELLYIGFSSSIYNRYFHARGTIAGNGHRNIRLDIELDNLYYKYKLTDESWMEKLLIRRLRPKYNCKRNTEKRYVSDAELLKSIIRS